MCDNLSGVSQRELCKTCCQTLLCSCWGRRSALGLESRAHGLSMQVQRAPLIGCTCAEAGLLVGRACWSTGPAVLQPWLNVSVIWRSGPSSWRVGAFGQIVPVERQGQVILPLGRWMVHRIENRESWLSGHALGKRPGELCQSVTTLAARGPA